MTLRRKLHMVHARPDGLTIHSRGGIGNQLFCLFAGIALADKLECRLYIDPSQHRYTAQLPFLVDQVIKKSPDGLSRTIECLREPQTQLGRMIRKIGIPRWCDFVEPSFQFSPDFFLTSKGSCAAGYFQSWRYPNRYASSVEMKSARQSNTSQRIQLLSAPATSSFMSEEATT